VAGQCGTRRLRQGRYSREHRWTFDGGGVIDASPSPSVVPAPWSNARHVDPEDHAAHEGCFIANSVKTEIVVM
jgi:hypothetical protein